MEKRRKLFFTVFLLVGTILTVALVIVGSVKVQNGTPENQSYAYVKPTPTIMVPEKPSQYEVLSPDGKYLLTMETLKNDESIKQSFSVKAVEDDTSVKIFDRKSSLNDPVTIPYNSFSPNNKYIMLLINDTEKLTHIVLRTDGKDITEGQKYAEIEKNFYGKYSDFDITDVTGWGGYSLVVVNTNNKDGKVGPSFWFDLSNLSFIHLSTRFN